MLSYIDNDIKKGCEPMALLDHMNEATVPYSEDVVIEAIVESVKKLHGFELNNIDENMGHIIVKTGVSLFSWGESITINIEKAISNGTQIKIISTPKTGVMFGGAADMGKNRKNIDSLFSGISEELKDKEKLGLSFAKMQNIDDVKIRMEKLTNLYESNLISKEEFDKKKAEILENI